MRGTCNGWVMTDVRATSKVTRVKVLHDMLGGVMESAIEANHRINQLEKELETVKFRLTTLKVFFGCCFFVILIFLICLVWIIPAK